MSASRINVSPWRRFSADRSAKMFVMARDFAISFVSALRSPPEIGGWWYFGAMSHHERATLFRAIAQDVGPKRSWSRPPLALYLSTDGHGSENYDSPLLAQISMLHVGIFPSPVGSARDAVPGQRVAFRFRSYGRHRQGHHSPFPQRRPPKIPKVCEGDGASRLPRNASVNCLTTPCPLVQGSLGRVLRVALS